jgi:hypothetical protein
VSRGLNLVGRSHPPGRDDSALPVPAAYREDVQATVATFSTDTHSGTVLLDTGVRLAFDADAFDRSGLRLLRLGQRLNIRVVDGQITALSLATLPLD